MDQINYFLKKIFQRESKVLETKEEYSLYQKYFDNLEGEDDESTYKKQLYILENENFIKKDESPLTLKHRSLLNRLILEDYSVYPLKKELEKNNNIILNIGEKEQNNENNNNDNVNFKEKRKSEKYKDKNMEELEKFAEDENEFIKDLHRINYITFSPFSLNFFNEEEIDENNNDKEKKEKIIEKKEKEKKLLKMINFDYNKYEFNDELLLNICHGFVDLDKLKEKNCINPFGIKDNNIKNENSDEQSLYESDLEEEEEEEVTTEEKEEKNDESILVSDLIDEIKKFMKERENIDFFKEYFDKYNKAKKRMNRNMKITDKDEKCFYKKWNEKFKKIDFLYKEYLMEKEMIEKMEKEKIEKELKELEEKKLKKKEEDQKFVDELKKIRRKTLQRMKEEKKEKIYYQTNELDLKKNKNCDNEQNEKNENKLNNGIKKSQTIQEKKNDRIEWMNTKKYNFFNDI